MNCKFCNAELPENVTLCTLCGKENIAETAEETVEEMTEEVTEEAAEETTEETTEEITEEIAEEISEENPEEPKKRNIWRIVLAAVGAVLLLGVLVCAVLYGTGAFNKTESYTVSDEKAINARETVVATVGEQKLSNSALHVYYRQGIEDFYTNFGYYLDPSVLDTGAPLDTQYYDKEAGTTWQEYFLEGALTTWSRYAALCMEAKEAGIEVPEDVLNYLDSLPAELDATAVYYGHTDANEMLAADMGAGCDLNGYMDYLTTSLYAGQYLDSLYAEMIPTMDEIEAYYSQHEETFKAQGIEKDGSISVDVRHILLCPEGGTEDANGNITYSDAEWEACRAEAQALLDSWKSSGATEDLFAQYAAEHTEDPGSMSTGGLYTDVTMGQMVEPFEQWCFDESRKAGDAGLVKTVYGYHIMYFVDSREIWISNVQETMIYERSLALVTEASEKWPADIDYKKIALGEITKTAE